MLLLIVIGAGLFGGGIAILKEYYIRKKWEKNNQLFDEHKNLVKRCCDELDRLINKLKNKYYGT